MCAELLISFIDITVLFVFILQEKQYKLLYINALIR
jgi:hypothetical protein